MTKYPVITRSLYIPRGADCGMLLALRLMQLKKIRAAALSLKLTLLELASKMDRDHLERAFKAASQEQVHAIIPTAGRQTLGARKPITDLAIKYRLPAIYQEQGFLRPADSCPTVRIFPTCTGVRLTSSTRF
jgi:hypothetical protein